MRAASGLGPEEPFAVRHGGATFAAFLLAGTVPLVAYLAPVPPEHRFASAILFTLLTLFAVGAARSLVTERRWCWNGIEMLLVGAAAAAVAYTAGDVIAHITVD